jgi:hypothetical protein
MLYDIGIVQTGDALGAARMEAVLRRYMKGQTSVCPFYLTHRSIFLMALRAG